jgi:asparagine synthase (glutamine-hydrolysing)
MCGITGYINLNGQFIGDTSVINRMLYVQKHRGPDDSGIRAFSLKSRSSQELIVGNILPITERFEGMLGFNRLSILDLSANGHQPMISPDKKIILVLNGEIYNVFDFKQELKSWGYRFRSTTDTEIVLALYIKYGFDKMLNMLNGMFAFVIIDLHLGRIFIARDRFGIKPMYYISSKNILAFSSELKSFRYLDDFRFKLDETRLDEHLMFRNNLHGTLFKDIKLLEPGHYLSFTLETGLQKIRYFNINDYSRSRNNSESFEFFEKKLEEWIDKSVRSQLMSDVKLGCQLSGGIDSSLVTCLANKNSLKGQFESVSIIFNNPHFSEEKYIDKVSVRLNLKSHKFLLDSLYYLQNLEKATWHFEAPLNHPNTIGIYLLSKRAREYVTVLLSGEGADEVFGGYTRFYDVRFPFSSKKLLHDFKYSIVRPGTLRAYINPAIRTLMATAYMQPSLAKKIIDKFSFSHGIEERLSLYATLTGSVFDRQVKYEIQTYLPDLLLRQDKMSMAHSIENRVPFLDNDVVANSFTIPEGWLMIRKSAEGFNNEKYMLKKIVSRMFDNNFAFRDKMGFGIPVKEYFKDPFFNEYFQDKVLPGIKKRGIFRHKIISEWMRNTGNLQYNVLGAFWIAITFEIWASVYLDNSYENWNTSF